jgi:hypothetical protein
MIHVLHFRYARSRSSCPLPRGSGRSISRKARSNDDGSGSSLRLSTSLLNRAYLFGMKLLCATIIVAGLCCLTARADDWTTTDGKTYKDVTVVKVEDDAVTILDHDGGARIALSNLNSTLQAKFHYDPAKAKIAAQKHDDEQKLAIQEFTQEVNAQAAPKSNLPAGANKVPSSSAPSMFVEVVQEVDNGVLAVQYHDAMVVDPESRSAVAHPSFRPSGPIIFIQGLPSSIAIHQKLWIGAWRNGNYKYIDTTGINRKAEKWDFVEMRKSQTD